LQHSYLLSDLKLLVPPHAAKPENRPPYFSIDTKPFDVWKLDIKVKGDQFLKVRTPFFNGVCSTDMHLGGTLVNPLALGDATINSGTVEFPFANLKINQGYVTLTTAHPYMPYLFVTGSTKAYDFDIHMNVTGPVDNPNIEFTSTPALTSEQILVMLTTGELPATTSGLSMQQRTLKVGAFVGKNLLSRFGVGAGSEQRLTLESARDVTYQNTQTYSAEYKLNPDWSVTADYNQFGGLNVGAKWRFYSK
jgi:translocation and assembly module TamB